MIGGRVRVGVEGGEMCVCICMCVREIESARVCLCKRMCVCEYSRACVFVFVYVSCSFALCIYMHIASIQSHTNLLSGNSIKKRDRRGEGG